MVVIPRATPGRSVSLRCGKCSRRSSATPPTLAVVGYSLQEEWTLVPTSRRSVKGLHALAAEPWAADPRAWGAYMTITHDVLGAVPQRESAAGVVSSTRTVWGPLRRQELLACPRGHRVQLSPARASRLAAAARRAGLDESLVDG